MGVNKHGPETMHPMSDKAPTKGQAWILWQIIQKGGETGPLGMDVRSYDACLRRGWIEEVPVEDRGFGFGSGTVVRVTDAGRAAYDQVDPRNTEHGAGQA